MIRLVASDMDGTLLNRYGKVSPYNVTVIQALAQKNIQFVVCTGRNCAGRDNLKVLQEVKRLLKIGSDGISEDGRVYMKTRACLKQCRTAPNIMVDGKICSGKSAEEIISMVMGHGADI